MSENNDVPYVIRKNGMYFAHNSCGYVHNPIAAELYDKGYAEWHASHADETIAIPVTDLFKDADQIDAYLERIEIIKSALLKRAEA